MAWCWYILQLDIKLWESQSHSYTPGFDESETIPVIPGVPQGSVWAHCSYLYWRCNNSLLCGYKLVLDADDVLLYRKNEYPEDYTTLQKDINSINNWKVSLSPSMCQGQRHADLFLRTKLLCPSGLLIQCPRAPHTDHPVQLIFSILTSAVANLMATIHHQHHQCY